MTLRSVAGPDLSAADLHAILRLRSAVFVVEQECVYQDIDGRDLRADTHHLWWQPADTPLACLRVLGPPGTERRVGRVCTAESARGLGLGAELMRAALALIGPDRSALAAQSRVADWYTRFGYVAEGPEYLDDGVPHITMRRPAEPRRARIG
ncbi:GNAT family N-acetyltransferase [Actinokineospora enzanensis]|uniref:GNAT family N-acetyltransferase n=1 Tax=Actinokineospora enzanensis TaxID=155975 RepID=UPI000371C826|nr:GNAT family N-acetyltransferase [Actinokineospora enzanensis]